MAQVGRVLDLAVRPQPGEPMRRVPEACAAPDGALAGDHGGSVRRGVTLLSREAWAEACGEVGRDLPWWTRRANVLVEGLDLGSLIGERLRLGGLLVLVGGETTPCHVMEAACPGLLAALGRHQRGGVHARVLAGGVLRVGDGVERLAPAAE